MQRVFYKYIWKDKKDKVKRDQMRMPFQFGGLRVPDLQIYCQALKVTWLRRAIFSNDQWYETILQNLGLDLGKILRSGCTLNKEYAEKCPNYFWKDVLAAWVELQKGRPNREAIEFGCLPLNCHYTYSREKKKVLDYWDSRGIHYLADLYGIGKVMEFKELERQYQLQRSTYLDGWGIVSSVRFLCRKENVMSPQRPELPIIPDAVRQLLSKKKGANYLYDAILMKRNFSLQQVRCIRNWEKDIEEKLEETEWKQLLRFHTRILDPTLPWFQFRLTHRILPTNSFLHRCGIKENEKCSLCNVRKDSLMHNLLTCRTIDILWEKIRKFVVSISEKRQMNKWDILLGFQANTLLDRSVATVLVKVKQYFFICHLRKQRPSLTGVKQTLSYYVASQKLKSKLLFCPEEHLLWTKMLNKLEQLI
jgi:hypothetical protein